VAKRPPSSITFDPRGGGRADGVRAERGAQPVGRAWIAIRDHDVAAASLGISMLRYKLLAFMISSFYCRGRRRPRRVRWSRGEHPGVQPRSLDPDPGHGHHRPAMGSITGSFLGRRIPDAHADPHQVSLRAGYRSWRKRVSSMIVSNASTWCRRPDPVFPHRGTRGAGVARRRGRVPPDRGAQCRIECRDVPRGQEERHGATREAADRDRVACWRWRQPRLLPPPGRDKEISTHAGHQDGAFASARQRRQRRPAGLLALVNSKGGVEGYRIRWDECEFGYQTPRALECYERYRKDWKIVYPNRHARHLRARDRVTQDRVPAINSPAAGRIPPTADVPLSLSDRGELSGAGGPDGALHRATRGARTSSRARRSRSSTSTNDYAGGVVPGGVVQAARVRVKSYPLPWPALEQSAAW